MTSPRIENAAQSFRPLVASDLEAAEASETFADAAIDFVQDVASEAADDFYGATLEPLVDAGAAGVRTAERFFEGGDDIRSMQNGDVVVSSIGASGSAHDVVGGGVEGAASMTVTRTDEVYEARFELDVQGSLGIGAEFMKQGGAADIDLGGASRLVVRGQGAAARDELARIVDEGLPAGALADSEHLDIVRVEVKQQAGVTAEVGVIAGASQTVSGTMWEGVDLADRRTGAFQRTEVAVEFEVSTPRIELQSGADEAALLRGVGHALGVAPAAGFAAELAEAGVSPGLKVEVEGTVSVETRVNTDEIVAHEIEVKLRGRAGSRSWEATHKATVPLSKLDAAALSENIAGAESAAEIISALDAAGVKTETTVHEITARGMVDIDLGCFELRRGVETRTPIWQLGGAVR